MDAGDANIPDAFDSISHGLGRQRSFFRNAYIARAGCNHSDLANSMLSVISPDADQVRRFVPFGFRYYISHFPKCAFIGMRDQNIRRMLNQPFNYADNLFATFALTKYYFRKTLPRRASMIYPRVTDVFIVKILDAAGRFSRFKLSSAVGCQQLF
jgi:hypothetical protein